LKKYQEYASEYTASDVLCKMDQQQNEVKEQDLWTQYLSSRMVHTHIQILSFWSSCMMGSVAVSCRIEF